MSEDDARLAAELAAEAAANPPEAASAPTLERMQQLAAEVNDIDERIAKNEARIAELNERRRVIVENELVEMMDKAHVQMIQAGGRIFKPQPYYKAVIPVAEQDHPGFTWLEEHEAGDLIKNQVIATFPRGTEEEAEAAVTLMRERFQMATVEKRRDVHHMTLTKWLREMHESGDPNKIMPPLDVIGGTIGRVVKITSSKS